LLRHDVSSPLLLPPLRPGEVIKPNAAQVSRLLFKHAIIDADRCVGDGNGVSDFNDLHSKHSPLRSPVAGGWRGHPAESAV